MKIARSDMVIVIAVGIIAAMVALLFVVPFVTGNPTITQTETYQLGTYDNKGYIPAEAIVTVSAPQTMYVAEGWEHVDVKVELVKHENVTGFKMTKLICYLGTLNDYRFMPSESSFHLFGESGSTFQTTMELDPKEVLHDARIQVSMGIEILYEDGSSFYLGGFKTQPVFGLYEVQDRFHLLMYSIPAVLIGATVISVYMGRTARHGDGPYRR